MKTQNLLKNKSFLEKAKLNNGKTLSKDLINKIQNEFGEVMKENGYNF